MGTPACLIVNMNAGGITKSVLGRVRRHADRQGLPLFLTRSDDDVKQAVSYLRNHTTDRIAVFGGDGTLINLLDHLRNIEGPSLNPEIIAFAAGTTNMIHRDVGFFLSGFENILRKARDNRLAPKVRTPLKVTFEIQDAECYERTLIKRGFFLGTANFPRIIENTRKKFHKVGMTGYSSEILSATGLISRLYTGRIRNHPLLAPCSQITSMDGKSWTEHEVVLSCITSLQSLVLGIRLNKDIGNIAKLDLIWPYRHLLKDIHSLRNKRSPSGQALRLEEISDPLFIKGMQQFILDGEIFNCKPPDVLKIEKDTPVRFLK